MFNEVERDMLLIIDSISHELKFKDKFQQGKSLALNSPHFLKMINLNLSHKEVAEKIGIQKNSVITWRKRNIPSVIYNKYFKTIKYFSKKEIMLINDLDKTDKELAQLLNRTVASVRQYRYDNLTELQREELSTKKHRHSFHKKIDVSQNKKNKSYSLSEIDIIVNGGYNLKELSLMFDRTQGAIESTQRRYKHLKKEVI